LTDFQAVWDTLKATPGFEKFSAANVKYIRNMDDCGSRAGIDPLVQKCWQKMFASRTDATQKCIEEKFECFWDSQNRLRRLTISNLQPFVRKHPVTSSEVWFNHINVLHKDSMAYDYQRTATIWAGFQGLWPLLLSVYYRALFGSLSLFKDETALGSTAVMEDGELLTAADFLAMKKAIYKSSIQNAYETNDIVLVDNLRIGHGREIYLGTKESRSIYTAWSDKYPAAWNVGT